MGGDDGYLDVGVIVRPHGIRGEVKVLPLSVRSEILLESSALVLVDESGRERRIKVEYTRQGSKHVLLKLAGVLTRNDAELLRGCVVKVRQETVPPLPEGSYTVFELVGLRVVTTGGERVGTVVDVISTAAQDVYVVKKEKGEALIPAVKAFVKKIDVEGGKIVVDPIEGLLD